MSVLRFGDFELDEQTLELRKSGEPMRIQRQPARVLAFLLNHRGVLVTREQIRLAIWGDDTFVDFEHGLNFCIRHIRQALNDQAEKPAYIETLPRLGYRFVGQIEKDKEEKSARGVGRIRIAVLPLEDLAAAPEDYFAAGLTEDMISALSRINPERLAVVAVRKSLASDAAQTQFDELQRHFNLDFVLRSSVRRSGQKLRITAQLHDLRDKSILWSETYDRDSSDLLAAQEEVTRRVSQSLALELFPSATVGTRRYARSSAAYDAYLKGRYFWHKMTAEGVERSITYFNEALSLDAGFAPALAGLADCYAQCGSSRVGTMKPLDALPQARAYLQRALDLDETLAEAHCTLGLIKSWYDNDWTGAEREFRVALELDPGQITALLWQSLLFLALGRNQEAIASVQRAREIEPLSPTTHLYLGLVQALAGQYDLGVRQIQQSIELDPNYYRSQMFLGMVLTSLKRFDDAIAALERSLELRPNHTETLAMLGTVYAAKGDRRRALNLVKKVIEDTRSEPAILIARVYAQLRMDAELFESLDRAVKVKSAPIYLVVISDEFVPYRSDPRFRRVLKSIGLSNSPRA